MRSAAAEVTATRVLHLASGDLWAGAEVQIYHLLCALHARPDTIVSALLLNPGELAERLQAAGIAVTVVDERTASTGTLLRCALREIRSTGARVVHTHRFKENIIGSVAARLSGRAISVRTVHGRPEHTRRNSLRHTVSRFLDAVTARLQAGIIGVSGELCEYLRAQLPRGKVFFVPNGIDTATVARVAAEPSGYVAQSKWNVVLLGRLVRVKRVDLFLEAAAQLAAAQPDRYRFVVVGDGPLLAEASGAAARLGLAGEVDFLGFQRNSLAILKQMDCLVMTSDHEGLPMVVLEALCLGVPIVAHAVGGLPEVLEGIPGHRLVSQHTPGAYAAAIAEVADLARDRSRGGQRSLLPPRFEISSTAEQYAKLYRDLLGGPALRS